MASAWSHCIRLRRPTSPTGSDWIVSWEQLGGKTIWILSRFLWSCFGTLGSGLLATLLLAFGLRLSCAPTAAGLGPSPGSLSLPRASFQIPAGKLDIVHAMYAGWSHMWLACWPGSWPEQLGCWALRQLECKQSSAVRWPFELLASQVVLSDIFINSRLIHLKFWKIVLV